MTTSVIIPNWQGKSLLEKNLPLVLKSGFDEVIVIDDASPDNSIQFLKENFPQVRVIRHSKNKGFAESVNDGVKASNGDVVFLLNLDVVPQGDITKPVLKHFQDSKVFGVSLHEEGYGWSIPELRDGFIGHRPRGEAKKPHKTFWVSGGSGAFRKSLWKNLGGMDTMFSPFYWEDVDLGYRALRRGYKLVWEPEARVLHKHESVINPKHFNAKFLQWIKERNHLLFNWKHLALKELVFFHLSGLVKRLLHPGYWIVFFLAFLKLPQVIQGRIIEKREAKFSNEEIVKEFS